MSRPGNRGGGGPPLIEACRLYPRTSARGDAYWVGRWGGVRVLVFAKKAEDEGDHTHMLMLGTTPKPDEGRGP